MHRAVYTMQYSASMVPLRSPAVNAMPRARDKVTGQMAFDVRNFYNVSLHAAAAHDAKSGRKTWTIVDGGGGGEKNPVAASSLVDARGERKLK